MVQRNLAALVADFMVLYSRSFVFYNFMPDLLYHSLIIKTNTTEKSGMGFKGLMTNRRSFIYHHFDLHLLILQRSKMKHSLKSR